MSADHSADGQTNSESLQRKSQLAKILLIWFLILSIVPLIIASAFGYRRFRSKVVEDVQAYLSLTSAELSIYVEEFLKEMSRDCENASDVTQAAIIIDSLNTDMVSRGLTASDYVGSHAWEELLNGRVKGLGAFKENLSFNDILLVSMNGDIMYSVAREKDLGLNLLEGDLADTNFADAFRRTVHSGKTTVSKFEQYKFSDGINSSFCTAPLINNAGHPVGVIATRFAVSKLDAGQRDHLNEDSKVDAYLIGTDLMMQNNALLGDKSTALIQEVDNPITRQWLSGLTAAEFESHDNQLYTYTGYQGNEVFGTHMTISANGLTLGVFVEKDKAQAMLPVKQWRNWQFIVVGLTILIVIFVTVLVSTFITRPLRRAAAVARQVAASDYSRKLDENNRTELGDLAKAMNQMIDQLNKRSKEEKRRTWINERASVFKNLLMEGEELDQILKELIQYICPEVGALAGCIYVLDSDAEKLRLGSIYTESDKQKVPRTISIGRGILGQAAADKKIRIIDGKDMPKRIIGSAIGDIEIGQIICMPLIFEDSISGVMELSFADCCSPRATELLKELGPNLAVCIINHLAKAKTLELLEETRAQAKLLARQQQELEISYQEISEKSEELNVQQEELRISNEELQKQSEELDAQKEYLQQRNLELQNVRDKLEAQAIELTESNRYKSQFLANMSHELRTPLNSILLLSRNLCENEKLNEEDRHSAGVIAKSGESLLEFINSLLDLSKIEARQIKVTVTEFSLDELRESLVDMFSGMAKDRELGFSIEFAEDIHPKFTSDKQKVEQILRNLISNGLKYTEKGEVSVRIQSAGPGGTNAEETVCFIIKDTGVGIPDDKKDLIFDAFKQLDGSLSRKVSGTGLGLSISRSLASILGGRIEMESIVGEGSTFRLYLPHLKRIGEYEVKDIDKVLLQDLADTVLHAETVKTTQSVEVDFLKNSGYEDPIEDDRDSITKGDRHVLVIEDDYNFASILKKNFNDRELKCLLAGTGEAGLELARKYIPKAIMLDMQLPGMSGKEFLSLCKENPDLRHIPVHVISGMEGAEKMTKFGVIGVLNKPIKNSEIRQLLNDLDVFWRRETRNLLIVQSGKAKNDQLKEIIGNSTVQFFEASTTRKAIGILKKDVIDCVVLDVDHLNRSLTDFFQEYTESVQAPPPIIIYANRQLSAGEYLEIEAYSDSIILKNVKSKERLLDETSLLLHRVVQDLPPISRRIISNLYNRNVLLNEKSVLLVDDDMKNLYTLGKELRGCGMSVSQVDSGRAAIDECKRKSFDMILMDIMMPQMDGLETIREIRQLEKQNNSEAVPIIVVSAKAMPGDRAKCLEVGANDYLVKPLNMDNLFGMMRIWLY